MSQLDIRVPLGNRSFEEIRPALDAALERDLPNGLVSAKWDGDRLVISGSGVNGAIFQQDGHLVAQAKLRLPASLMRPMFEQRVGEVLHDAVAESA